MAEDAARGTAHGEGGGESWLEQTQYLARRIYEDPLIGTIPLDTHAACAIGNYECVQEAVNKGADLNQRNKGICMYSIQHVSGGWVDFKK